MNTLTIVAYTLVVAATVALGGWCYQVRDTTAHGRGRLLAVTIAVVWGLATGAIAHDTRLADPAAWSPLTALAIFTVWQGLALRDEAHGRQDDTPG